MFWSKLMSKFKCAFESISFLKRYIHNPSAVGSLAPSSSRLGYHLVKMARDQQEGPLCYLEVGGGSGALTPSILKQMRAEDRLDIVELDPKFCTLLRKKFGHLANVCVHEGSILDFSGTNYDIVISSLPLNVFTPELVDKIFKKFENLVKPGGYLSYFEYRWLEKLKCAYLLGNARLSFKEIINLKKKFLQTHCREIKPMWWNILPAKVFHCKM